LKNGRSADIRRLPLVNQKIPGEKWFLGTVRRKTWGYVMGLVTGVVGALAFLIPVLGSVVGAGRSLLGPNPDGATLTSIIGVVSFFSVGFAANALIVAGLTRTRAAFGR
jgi:hypothetical protein